MPIKLIVRTADLGYPLVQGQLLSEDKKKHTPPSLHERRYVAVQVSSSSGIFDGCCHPHCQRLIILREMNFVSYHRGQWDLYVTSCKYENATSTQDGFTCLHMVLVPQQDCHTMADCRYWEEWVFLGPCHACVLGMDLEAMIGKYLGRRGSKTSHQFHWHLDVYMDSFMDETYCCVSKAFYNHCGAKEGPLSSPIQNTKAGATHDDEMMTSDKSPTYASIAKVAAQSCAKAGSPVFTSLMNTTASLNSKSPNAWSELPEATNW